MNKKGRVDSGAFLLLVSSVFLAGLLINVCIGKGFSFDYLFLDIYNIKTDFNDDFISVITFITMKRLKQFIILFVLSQVVNKKVLYNGFIAMFGIMIGVFITIQTYYNGITGVFTLILYVFPHFIVYFMLIKEMCTEVYDKQNSKKFLAFMLLLLSGILCEAFFSRFFLIKFYQYMVLA